MKKITINEKNCIYGQYDGYVDEFDVKSKTITYAMVNIQVDLTKWCNIPFVLVCGKNLQEKSTKIILRIKKSSFKYFIEFINNKDVQFIDSINNIESMVLYFNFHLKNIILLINDTEEYMIYNSTSIYDLLNENHSGYELIFKNLLNNENNNFKYASYDEIHSYLELFSKISEDETKANNLFIYKKGIKIPKEPLTLLKKLKDKCQKESYKT